MTRAEIALTLKKLRISKGLTQAQAAAEIGRKQQTLAAWETGVSQPDANTLFQLCALYGVKVSDAFENNSSSFSAQELSFLKKYRALDSAGKEAVDQILNCEYLRMKSTSPYGTDNQSKARNITVWPSEKRRFSVIRTKAVPNFPKTVKALPQNKKTRLAVPVRGKRQTSQRLILTNARFGDYHISALENLRPDTSDVNKMASEDTDYKKNTDENVQNSIINELLDMI